VARENPEAVADLIIALWAREGALEAKNAELTKNSRNSSKPPSTDNHGPNRPDRRVKGGPKRKPGGQPGHKGSTLVFYFHPKRGADAMNDMGILPGYPGRIINDFLSSYYHFRECKHNLCNAHHLRELGFVHESMGQKWAEDMIELLLEAELKISGCFRSLDAARAFDSGYLEPDDRITGSTRPGSSPLIAGT
jgi:hypothetical protein